ncbi:MAG: MerR family transcriptional regulator [Acidimicrobiia bacterium]|nr:MerR family transcriptional regulator [Acidimicrobiia bacterium]
MATEYRIDELAREAGTTVRNVRAYQDRGLLPPPRRSGRVGLYTDAHLARLRLIGQLLDRGFTLGNIAELITAWEQGQDLAELLGLEAELVQPWSDEVATTISLDDLNELFGQDDDALREAVKLGLLEPEEGGDGFSVPSPRLLHAGAELVAAGIPLDAVLNHARQLARDTDRIAARFVELVSANVFEPYGDRPFPAKDVPRLAELLRRLRPLAETTVDAYLARAMEQRLARELGNHYNRLMGHLGEKGA